MFLRPLWPALTCAAAHIGLVNAGEAHYRVGRDAEFQEGTRTMFRQHHPDAAELYALEHRFPFVWTVFSLLMAGNTASAVLMLLAQA